MDKVKFFNGNIKVGDMLTFNKLAGNIEWNGCKGTCGEHCKGCFDASNPYNSSCYVIKSYRQYKDSVIKPHTINTIGMREHLTESFAELDKRLTKKKKIVPIRIHSSGEFETVKEIEGWINLASKHPNMPFYVYTKAFDLVDEVLTKNSKLPSNFFINISIWHDSGVDIYNKWKHLDNIRAFVYDDGYDYKGQLDFDCHCPAYDKTGKLSHDLTCDRCKICFQDKAKICACYSH